MELSLQLGDMSTKELAQWFGISYDYFKKKAKIKYKELEEYCKYDKLHGKVHIHQIYCSIYIKNQSLYEQIDAFTFKHWRREEPETITRVAGLFMEMNPDVTVVFDTVKSYVSKAKQKYWGKTDSGIPGEIGGCYEVYVKMYKGATPAYNRYEFITEEERDAFIRIQNKYFGPKPEKLAVALENLYNKVWDSDTFVDYLQYIPKDKTDKYLAYTRELSYELGCHWMVNATYAEDGAYYVLEKNEDGTTYRRRIEIEQPGAWSIKNQKPKE